MQAPRLRDLAAEGHRAMFQVALGTRSPVLRFHSFTRASPRTRPMTARPPRPSQHAGRVWRFGDNLNTDVLAPGQYMKFGIEEIARHCLEAVEPRFAREVQRGDVLVAGRNCGAGSSRRSEERRVGKECRSRWSP